jgi:multidrug resistance efflux pump
MERLVRLKDLLMSFLDSRKQLLAENASLKIQLADALAAPRASQDQIDAAVAVAKTAQQALESAESKIDVLTAENDSEEASLDELIASLEAAL